MKKKMFIQTLLISLLCVAGCLLSGQMRQEVFDIGDYSGVDIPAAEECFAQSQSNEDLIGLLKALCWRYNEAESDETAALIVHYGQILLDRAKAGTVDLEFVDNPEHMLQVLKIVRRLGAS